MTGIGKTSEGHSRSQLTVHGRRSGEGTRVLYPGPKTPTTVDETVGTAIKYVRLLEAAVAELTKQVGGLTQEVRGMKSRLDSIDSRLAKVEAWESKVDSRLAKVEAWEGRLDAVEQQLREQARSPARRRSPSPGSKCFS